MRAPISILISSLVALPAFAEPMKPIEVPVGNHPYAVLGITTGMLGTEAEALMAERGITLTPEVMELRASMPSGAMFDLQYDSRLLTQGVSVNTRLSGQPYEEVIIQLDTGVLERRVLSVRRTLVAANEDLPQYPALRQQLVELYGEPSEEKSESGGFTLTYAWIEGQKVESIEALPYQQFEFMGSNGRMMMQEAKPCMVGTNDIAFRGQERTSPIAPGCSAKLTVSYGSGAPNSSISFSLTDYDLMRLNQDESMRQINEALNPSSPAKASNMDL